jgi:hypothetical protein
MITKLTIDKIRVTIEGTIFAENGGGSCQHHIFVSGVEEHVEISYLRSGILAGDK